MFDTDVNNTKILKENLIILKRYSSLNSEDIIFLQSVKCFEDELVRSASKIASINEVFNTTSVDEFKKKFINCKNIPSKLNSLDFDIKKMWISKLPSIFKEYKNDTSHIIIKRK